MKWWIGLSMNLFAKTYLGVEYLNLDNLPENGPAVVAPNHFSHLDGLLINAASAYRARREVVFLAAEDVYNNNLLFRMMCNIVNCIPVKRDEKDRVALLKAMRILKRGKLLGLFPEGRRSRDGTIGEAKDGVAIIALTTGCPVIPVGIDGTFEALPRNHKFIKPAKVNLIFGKALVYPKQRKPSQSLIADVKQEIMYEIKKLRNEAFDFKERRIAA
jgi:1-acyl-sn-glycerol-3-phosphate acyltransferase